MLLMQRWWNLWDTAGLDTKQRKELEYLTGCKLPQLWLLKQSAVKEWEAERPCFVLWWYFGVSVKCHTVVLGWFTLSWERHCWIKSREISQGCGERERVKNGLLDYQLFSRAMLTECRSVCVCAARLCWQQPEKRYLPALWKLCLGADIHYYSKSTVELIQGASAQGDAVGLVSLRNWLQHNSLESSHVHSWVQKLIW